MKAWIVENVRIELNMVESNQLFDAISRVTKNTEKSEIERFAEQDLIIFKKTLNVLENASREI